MGSEWNWFRTVSYSRFGTGDAEPSGSAVTKLVNLNVAVCIYKTYSVTVFENKLLSTIFEPNTDEGNKRFEKIT
jgi:hypothetical protein